MSVHQNFNEALAVANCSFPVQVHLKFIFFIRIVQDISPWRTWKWVPKHVVVLTIMILFIDSTMTYLLAKSFVIAYMISPAHYIISLRIRYYMTCFNLFIYHAQFAVSQRLGHHCIKLRLFNLQNHAADIQVAIFSSIWSNEYRNIFCPMLRAHRGRLDVINVQWKISARSTR